MIQQSNKQILFKDLYKYLKREIGCVLYSWTPRRSTV